VLIQFSQHAKEDRVYKRLAGHVTSKEIVDAIRANESTINQIAFIPVKKFPQRIYLDEFITDDTPKGDLIVCKVKRLDWNTVLIITVMLRKSTSQSESYRNQ